MKIPFAFRQLALASGDTIALAAPPGGRLRVHRGRIWATTGGEPDDVWLQAGEEHVVAGRKLTVIESLGASTVELLPPAAIGAGRLRPAGYRSDVPHRACAIAALAMALVSFGALVILPAKLSSGGRASANAVATTPGPAVTAKNIAREPAPRS